MDLHWGDHIDTACTGCGGDAVDWVEVPDGTRRYACEGCLDDLLRYSDGLTLADLPETPRAVFCGGCGRLTLHEDAGMANRCPDCEPADPEEVLEAAQAALEADSDTGA